MSLRSEFLNIVHNQICDAFKSQDPELFDKVVFEIDGKELYAEKLRLSVVSPTLKSMLSERWNSNNEPIKITGYKFDDFKEFITFLYRGYCNFTHENIFTMVDIGEFYQVSYLKELCDEYLSEMYHNFKNILQFIELSNKYSLVQLKKSLQEYVSEREFFGSEEFLMATKTDIHNFIALEPKPEELFQAIYQWSEHQATIKQNESNDDTFNLNDAIKAEISEFLLHFQFKKMNMRFLKTFVAERIFVFSDEQLNDILDILKSIARVKVTNSFGQSISGYFPYETNEATIETIKSLKDSLSFTGANFAIYWETCAKFPGVPGGIMEKDGIKYFLVYFENGDIGIKHHLNRSSYFDFLLAEMFIDDNNAGFVPFNCKIGIE